MARDAAPPAATPTAVRTYHHADFPPERLAQRDATVSVCVPTRECADTIGAIAGVLVGMRDRGLIDEVVVVDAASADGTAGVAAAAGATVHQESALLPELGPARGKGDALWRALSVLRGDVVAYVDGDSENFAEHFVSGIVGPLVREPEVHYVKGFFRRPLRMGDELLADEGGRVTELTAKPLLRAFYPELSALRQPLAGEMAARRWLWRAVPFTTGYGVETALNIDVLAQVGIDAFAQTDLDLRQNRHQPLQRLSAMADDVVAAVVERLRREGRLADAAGDAAVDADAGSVVRPPMADVRVGGD